MIKFDDVLIFCQFGRTSTKENCGAFDLICVQLHGIILVLWGYNHRKGIVILQLPHLLNRVV